MGALGLLRSMWNYKCPRCRKSPLYISPFNISSPLAMHKRCGYCDLNFEPEPGYYFGAMFISYGISAVYFLTIAAIAFFAFGMGVKGIMGLIIFIGVVSFLKILRLSRSVWIHIMTRYQANVPKHIPD